MSIRDDLKPNETKQVFMNFEDYIHCPFPKGSSALSAEVREAIIGRYKNKLEKVIVREMNKFDYRLYHDKMNDIYVCHLKVPSEVVPKLRYDVVIKFFTNVDSAKKSNNLNKYYVQFFSNDPAYNFTFCNVHIEHGLYYTDLYSKSCKKAIKEKPDIKNPKSALGYVKSLVFAYFIMRNKSLFDKTMYEVHGTKLDVKTLLNSIMDSDDKIAQRQELGNEIERNLSKSKKHGISGAITTSTDDKKYTATSKNSRRTKTINSVKSSKIIKPSKKTTKK